MGDQAWKGDLLAFVDKNRALLGFGPGERAVRIGNRIYKSYANGARSAGYVSTIEEPRPRPPPTHPLVLSGIGSVALVVRSPGCGQLSGGFRNTLPPFDADLAAPPGIDGHEGLQVFHDLNPYLEVEPVDGAKGPRYATRLVATVTRTLEARLAWDVRYSYSCWNVDYAKRPPILERHMDHAYIDARSGALVYGRKPRCLDASGASPEHATCPVRRSSSGRPLRQVGRLADAAQIVSPRVGSVTSASSFILPLQHGHVSTSNPNVLLRSSAHGR